jgi:hypothetical protein
MMRTGLGLAVLAGAVAVVGAAEPRAPREALKPFNDLVGTWKATGTPEGTREEKQRGFWTESMTWGWQFKGDDAWLTVSFEKGKHFRKGELRYLPDKDLYQLTLGTTGDESLTFTGKLEEKRLTLSREDEKKKETQQLVISLLHENRFLYRYDVKPQGKTLFNRQYQVGATKEGVAFASGDGRPECVVSGGLGTIRVTHKGQTYYVCCSGCRDAFNDNPEKFIKEFEEAKKKKKQ